MRYMLLIYSPESGWSTEERERCMETSSAIARELAAQGKLLYSSPLQPVATAGTVRVRGGERMVTAGPFAETTEQLGGFYLLDVATQEEAIEVAKRLPPARKGMVEVRPLWEIEGRPTDKLAPGSEKPSTAANLPRFMFLCYHEGTLFEDAGEEGRRTGIKEAVALTHKLDAQGKYLGASPLQPASTAVSVRVRNDRPIVTDGPYAETREVLAGYYVIRAKDLAEALEFAAEHPGCRFGSTEVRPVFDI
jgi:hypothetical protein